VPLGPTEIPQVIHVRFPTANMPSHDVGQINFSSDGKGYAFLMPRTDFQRLGRKIAQLLAGESSDALPQE
jgi:hypothetical protein